MHFAGGKSSHSLQFPILIFFLYDLVGVVESFLGSIYCWEKCWKVKSVDVFGDDSYLKVMRADTFSTAGIINCST